MKLIDGFPVKECIGCGYCCSTALCDAAVRLYGKVVLPCPALKWNGSKNRCELMSLPGNLGEWYRKSLYAGEGCCSNLNSWRKEPIEDRTKPPVKVSDKVVIPSMMQYLLSALSKEFISGDTWYLALTNFSDMLCNNGYTEEEVKQVINRCVSLIKNQRSNFIDSFTGSIPE